MGGVAAACSPDGIAITPHGIQHQQAKRLRTECIAIANVRELNSCMRRQTLPECCLRCKQVANPCMERTRAHVPDRQHIFKPRLGLASARRLAVYTRRSVMLLGRSSSTLARQPKARHIGRLL